jgi:hypothetical protein
MKNTDLDLKLQIWLLFGQNWSKTNKYEIDENDSNNSQISQIWW